MNVAFESFFSERAKGMKASEIRELLKLTQAKDIISLAGGLPNPDAFPVDLVKKLANEVLEKNGKSALQYGTTEGLPALREAFADNYNHNNIPCTPETITIVGGSQQGIDLLSKIFLNPKDDV
ncbi:MAG: aminotransferase class I/II-fold pyridoxal phosphate-dependent enzyme, partial [Candidatus Thermoplasmatota archaeon]|nr:aminotransferase class I/II-fold pyridoxal phosphate-dependent enzyme [Candidatus Thermoplasmatota archaeon]